MIRPDLDAPEPGRASAARVALQGHFHYPDLLPDLLRKLSINRQRCDLLLSTSDARKAEALRAATARYRKGRVDIRVVPNRGRDLGPLLTGFREEIARDYDIVGHVHGKRSLGVDAALGETWREFLWQHLVGDLYPAMDVAVAHLTSDPRLGLVFPEDPHLVGWADNHEIAEDLAARAGIAGPLPLFWEFPVGTMFWARREALAPLLALELDWDDYPEEPIANDGTILHALERLLPLAAKQAGFGFAAVSIAGLTR